MGQILFPTDFSDISLNAFVYALHLADKAESSLDVLHVFNRPDISGVDLPKSLKEVYDSIDIDELEEFKGLVPKLREIAKENKMEHLTMKHLIIEGEVVYTINKIAADEDANLIVMGTSGASDLKEKLFGSATRGVIEEGSHNVLTVPGNSIFDGMINNLVFLTNYYQEEQKALEQLIEFAEPFQAHIQCLHFENDGSTSDQLMTEWEKGMPHNKSDLSFEVVHTEDIEQGLIMYCQKNQVDLVAMPSARCNFFEKWFGHCLDRQLTFHLETPLMHIHI